MLSWTRWGKLFPPTEGSLPAWMGSYAALPYAVPLPGRRAQVFFSGRDALNRAQIGACVLDLDALSVLPGSVTPEPLVSTGPPGAFDDSGCSMSCVVRDGDRWLLYYTGWALGRTVPFYLAIGLAVSEDGGRTFRKASAAPVLDRHAMDPFLTASPSVLVEDGLWRMWYVSGVRWELRPEGARHYYLIKYAESRDGVDWQRDGRVALGFADPSEHAIGRPHVLHVAGRYRMWYCVRGSTLSHRIRGVGRRIVVDAMRRPQGNRTTLGGRVGCRDASLPDGVP